MNGVEVAWAHPAEVLRGKLHGWAGVAGHASHVDPLVSSEWEYAHRPCMFDAGKLIQAFQDLFVECGARLQIPIGFAG